MRTVSDAFIRPRRSRAPRGGAWRGALISLGPVVGVPPNHKISHSTSTNWSGYAVSGAGPYTSVAASWKQPAVNCSQTPTGWSSFWVGLDGDTTGTVEQTGTEADCSSGTAVYYAWYEMYPKFPVQYSNPVSPGDSFSASVLYLGKGSFRLILSDTSKGWTQQTIQRLELAKLGSAEVIAEAPSSNGGVLPLADFGTIGVWQRHRRRLAPLELNARDRPDHHGLHKRAVKAKPSAISNGGFSDIWFSQ
jgi:peptidase A4-like protein